MSFFALSAKSKEQLLCSLQSFFIVIKFAICLIGNSNILLSMITLCVQLETPHRYGYRFKNETHQPYESYCLSNWYTSDFVLC